MRLVLGLATCRLQPDELMTCSMSAFLPFIITRRSGTCPDRVYRHVLCRLKCIITGKKTPILFSRLTHCDVCYLLKSRRHRAALITHRLFFFWKLVMSATYMGTLRAKIRRKRCFLYMYKTLNKIIKRVRKHKTGDRL